MENFIRVYKNAYDIEYCKQLIDYFETACAAGFGRTRLETENCPRTIKDDISVSVQAFMDKSLRLNNHFIVSKFFDLFFLNFYKQYVSEFSVIQNPNQKHAIYSIKIQKTNPGGGYHVWHYENSDKTGSLRVCAFNLYLNTVEEGGETEFLYYGLRVKPEQGDLVIWPVGFTHTHRGNPPLKETKYLLTGWVEIE